MPMVLSALLGVVLGLLVAYFMATWILVLCTLIVVWMFWGIFHSKGSGTLGVFLLFGPGLATGVLSMWILWLFLPGGVMDNFSLSSLVTGLEFAKKIFLR